jgi:hypothetical protein
MMDHSLKEWVLRINRAGKSFGNKLRKGVGAPEWNINKKIIIIDSSSLINLTNSLTSLIKVTMQQETTPKEQMLN